LTTVSRCSEWYGAESGAISSKISPKNAIFGPYPCKKTAFFARISLFDLQASLLDLCTIQKYMKVPKTLFVRPRNFWRQQPRNFWQKKNIFGFSEAKKWRILRIFPKNAPKSNVHRDEALPTLIYDKQDPKD